MGNSSIHAKAVAKPSPDRQLVRQTLAVVMEHAAALLSGPQFCLVGTASAVLRGVPLHMGDIDLLMKERQGVDAFSAALSSFPCLTPPTVLDFQYYAAYDVHGIQVEASTVELATEADCVEVMGEGPWKYHSLVDCESWSVPTVAIELRLATELMRDRRDRYAPLMDWMKRNGFNRDLLCRAMAARHVSQETQGRALVQMGSGA